jgi:hypothetical protein
MKRVSIVLASLFIGGLSAGAYAQTISNSATGGANHSIVPTFQANVNAPTSVQLPINVLGSQHADLVSNQNTNQSNQNSVGNAAAATTFSGLGGLGLGSSSDANAGNTSYQGIYTPTFIHSFNGG